jgi:hypothetical protein
MTSNLTVIENQEENNFVAGMIKEYIRKYIQAASKNPVLFHLTVTSPWPIDYNFLQS